MIKKIAVVFFLLSATMFSSSPPPAAAQTSKAISAAVAYLSEEEGEGKLPPLSPLDIPAADSGMAGARLGVADNNTTGKFLRHRYKLSDFSFTAGAPLKTPKQLRLIIADLPAESLLAAAKARPDALFFNIRAEDDELREVDCVANIFHIIPSRAMRADALAQYFVWKRWQRWFLIKGGQPADTAWAAALTRAAQKFGITIAETRTYEYEATARRTDSGHMQIQRQIPAFTQDAAPHDVVVAADESEVFAEYLPHRATAPRPIAGSAGLRAVVWHPAAEQWGATQLQRRFRKKAKRPMNERDYAGWLAMRVIGEAITRTGSADPKILRAYLLGGDFTVAGFKGQAMTFRGWNQQLRQPLLLAGARMVVSASPQEGFLHERSPLDSLGLDLPDSRCRLNPSS
jgi:ABC transporter substrate binding protein (PQQ-dependent alcohol dehydrogenase system)